MGTPGGPKSLWQIPSLAPLYITIIGAQSQCPEPQSPTFYCALLPLAGHMAFRKLSPYPAAGAPWLPSVVPKASPRQAFLLGRGKKLILLAHPARWAKWGPGGVF